MFTGIIQSIGHIAAIERSDNELGLSISCEKLDLSDCQLGDSIAINGVCLTVVGIKDQEFNVDVSAETLSCTTLSQLQLGDALNLEKSLLPTTRLGGHLVSGHVDGVGEVDEIIEEGDSLRITISIPSQLAKYIAAKGSVCIDGVSLTVNRITGANLEINIIPHTQQQTIFESYDKGKRVNVEVDIIARYLERLLLSEGDRDKINKKPSTFIDKQGLIRR